jgi:4-hydroxy-tetrahydrodipicolinate synthase
MMEADTVIDLSRNERIIGIKDASGKLDHVEKILNSVDPSRFVVLSGEDHLVAQVMQLGGKGVISASANIAPAYFVAITDAAFLGMHDEAERLQEFINPLVKNGVFYKTSPIPLAHMFDSALRLPLLKLSDSDDLHIRNVVLSYSANQLGIDILKYNTKWAGMR